MAPLQLHSRISFPLASSTSLSLSLSLSLSVSLCLPKMVTDCVLAVPEIEASKPELRTSNSQLAFLHGSHSIPNLSTAIQRAERFNVYADDGIDFHGAARRCSERKLRYLPLTPLLSTIRQLVRPRTTDALWGTIICFAATEFASPFSRATGGKQRAKSKGAI